MPQLSNLVLPDRASTPVNHTFAPRDISGGVATLVESNGVPISDRTLTLSLNRTSTGRYKATMKLAIPVVQDAVVNGVTRKQKVRTAYADITFTFDETSELQERKDLCQFVSSALSAGKQPVEGVFVNLEGVY